jgi:hypothetical protein
MPRVIARAALAALGVLRPPVHAPVHDLGRVPVGCPRKSGESGSGSSAWLPASRAGAPATWHPGALVLVTIPDLDVGVHDGLWAARIPTF